MVILSYRLVQRARGVARAQGAWAASDSSQLSEEDVKGELMPGLQLRDQ